jgi:hypothetical protein
MVLSLHQHSRRFSDFPGACYTVNGLALVARVSHFASQPKSFTARGFVTELCRATHSYG